MEYSYQSMTLFSSSIMQWRDFFLAFSIPLSTAVHDNDDKCHRDRLEKSIAYGF